MRLSEQMREKNWQAVTKPGGWLKQAEELEQQRDELGRDCLRFQDLLQTANRERAAQANVIEILQGKIVALRAKLNEALSMDHVQNNVRLEAYARGAVAANHQLAEALAFLANEHEDALTDLKVYRNAVKQADNRASVLKQENTKLREQNQKLTPTFNGIPIIMAPGTGDRIFVIPAQGG